MVIVVSLIQGSAAASGAGERDEVGGGGRGTGGVVGVVAGAAVAGGELVGAGCSVGATGGAVTVAVSNATTMDGRVVG